MSSSCAVCGPEFLDWLSRDGSRLALWQSLPRRRLRRGQLLPDAGMAWVQRGLLRTYFLDPEGRERNHAFIAELNWLGLPDGALMSPGLMQTQALEASELVEVSGPGFLALQQAWPEATALVLQGMAEGLRRQTLREQQLLMLDATARYQHFLVSEPALAARLSQRQLASYLGITDVALSRLRRRATSRAGAAPAIKP